MHATWVGALCAGLVLVAFTARAHATAGPRHRGVDVAFVLAGPLAKRCGLSCAADVPVARWASLADALSAVLGTPPDIYDVRVHQYYLPVYFWLRALLDARAAGSAPLCVGLQCVQVRGGRSEARNRDGAAAAGDALQQLPAPAPRADRDSQPAARPVIAPGPHAPPRRHRRLARRAPPHRAAARRRS
jgi:hypothetical protein